jgi:hypothetical protein
VEIENPIAIHWDLSFISFHSFSCVIQLHHVVGLCRWISLTNSHSAICALWRCELFSGKWECRATQSCNVSVLTQMWSSGDFSLHSHQAYTFMGNIIIPDNRSLHPLGLLNWLCLVVIFCWFNRSYTITPRWSSWDVLFWLVEILPLHFRDAA